MANNTFLVPSAEEAAANAYNQGFRDGYSKAVHEDILEIQASIQKHDDERQAIKKEVTPCTSQRQTN